MGTIAFITYGYNDKVNEFIKDLKSRHYPCPKYHLAKGRDPDTKSYATVNHREMRFHLIDFLNETRPHVMADLATVCQMTFDKRVTGDGKIVQNNVRNHPFRARLFRYFQRAFIRLFGLRPVGSDFKYIEPSWMDHEPNYYLAHGIMMFELPDEFVNGVEQL